MTDNSYFVKFLAIGHHDAVQPNPYGKKKLR